MSAATLLIIDDDRGISEGLAMLLEDEGYSVALALNGSEGLQYLASHEAPRLILLDLMMPVMDGFTFRENQLKHAEISKIPVVVMTAGALDQRALAMNAATLIKKPIDIDPLLSAACVYCGTNN